MLDLYESYNSQEERESDVMLESASINLDRAILAYETANAMGELQMREAECKLVMEAGNVTDLADYYEEATGETEQKQQGLLKTIWQKILDVIEKIHNWVNDKLLHKADPNATVEVDEGFFERHKKIGAAVTAVKNFLAKPFGKAAVALITAIGAILLIKFTGKKKTAKVSECTAIVESEEKQVSGLRGLIQKMFGKKIVDDGKKAVSYVSKFINWVKENIAKGVEAVKSVINKKKTKAAGKAAGKEAASEWAQYGAAIDESADDDDDEGDAYEEDAGDLSDIAALLATF